MEFEFDQSKMVTEKRLVKTLITKKPRRDSFNVSVGVVIFMALTSQMYWQNIFNISEFLPAVNSLVYDKGQWWRIFTATFIHGDLGHYLSNMLMLGILGFFVYGYFGSKIYPWLCFLMAGLVNALAILTYPPEVRLLGASGLVYLLGGLWLCLYFLIQRQHKVLSRLLRVAGIGVMIFFPTTFTPTTSYRTHAIGFVVGVVVGVVYFLFNKRSIRRKEEYKINYDYSEN